MNKLKEKNVEDEGLSSTNLSDLPNEILVKIISLLLYKQVVRTSILSKRWKYLWRLIPDGSSLYICTFHSKYRKENHARYTIYSVRLSDLLYEELEDGGGDASKSKSESNYTIKSSNSKLELRKGASIGDDKEDRLPYWMSCGVFGSKILFAGGWKFSTIKRSPDIYVFETSTTCQDDEPMPPMIHKCPHVLFEELDGKLFALCRGRVNLSETTVFKMFDPNVRRWATFTVPFCFKDAGDIFSCDAGDIFSCAVVGTNIMVSTHQSPLYCFDVTSPNPEWRKCSRNKPFPFPGRALVLDDDDSTRNHSKLMIACGIGLHHIVAYRMSNVKGGNIELEKIRGELPLPQGFGGDHCKFRFVHLEEGPRVCFAMSYFQYRLADKAKGIVVREMRLLVMTFEYSFSDVHESSSTSFSGKILGSHVFEFDWAQESAQTFAAELLGCFLL